MYNYALNITKWTNLVRFFKNTTLLAKTVAFKSVLLCISEDFSQISNLEIKGWIQRAGICNGLCPLKIPFKRCPPDLL